MKTFRMFFPGHPSSSLLGGVLLLARLAIGLMFMNHGMQKWLMYGELYDTFPDPLGVGSAWSLILIIMAEVVCSVFFMLGFLYRVVLLPMIFAMGMVFFVIHDGSLSDGGELSLVYMLVFVLMYLIGPGKYSVDAWLRKRWIVDVKDE